MVRYKVGERVFLTHEIYTATRLCFFCREYLNAPQGTAYYHTETICGVVSDITERENGYQVVGIRYDDCNNWIGVFNNIPGLRKAYNPLGWFAHLWSKIKGGK